MNFKATVIFALLFTILPALNMRAEDISAKLTTKYMIKISLNYLVFEFLLPQSSQRKTAKHTKILLCAPCERLSVPCGKNNID